MRLTVWAAVLLATTWVVVMGADTRLCPRQLDFEAARMVEGTLHPAVRAAGVELSPSCPFHPDHDRMRLVRLSREIGAGRYRCAFCAAEVASQTLLDEHVLTHAHQIPSSSTRCWSDFCAMLDCPSAPRVEAVDRLFELHRCRDVLGSCVDRKTELFGALVRRFCARFTGVSLDGAADEMTSESWRVLRYLGLAFVGILVVVFYVLVCLWRSEVAMSADLPAGGGSWWWRRLTRAAKRKEKGY